MTAIEKAVLGDALQTAIGEADVQAVVFTTHDLDPQFFEAEILPVFLGNDLKHTQRTGSFSWNTRSASGAWRSTSTTRDGPWPPTKVLPALAGPGCR